MRAGTPTTNRTQCPALTFSSLVIPGRGPEARSAVGDRAPSGQRSQTQPGSQQPHQPPPRSQTGPAYRPQTAPMPQHFRPARPQTGPMPHVPMPGPPCGPWWPHHMGHPPPPPVWPADPRLVPSGYFGPQPPPGWLQAQLHYHGMLINLISASLSSLHPYIPGTSCQLPVHMHNAYY